MSHVLNDVPREVNIPVPWGVIAGKWWGPTNIKPILCLHGIQDNCGTFNKLIPYLLEQNVNISYLAIDFPGHGYSTALGKGVTYNFMLYPMLIERILRFFNWEKIGLLGHSIGATTSFCYTLLYPERVHYLICIDGFIPLPTKITASHTKKQLDDLIKYDKFNDNPRTYLLDEMVERITKPLNNSVKRDVALELLERNITPTKTDPQKYYFHRDNKLKMDIVYQWPKHVVIKGARNLKNPMFLCKAVNEEGEMGVPNHALLEYLEKVILSLINNHEHFHLHVVEGTHHLHLNEPKNIGSLIKEFLDTYHFAEEISIDLNRVIFCETPLSPFKLTAKL